jgi:hypothetical protein
VAQAPGSSIQEVVDECVNLYAMKRSQTRPIVPLNMKSGIDRKAPLDVIP